VVDRFHRTNLGGFAIKTGPLRRAPLTEKLRVAIELHLDRRKPSILLLAQPVFRYATIEELMLLGDEVVEVCVYPVRVHRCALR